MDLASAGIVIWAANNIIADQTVRVLAEQMTLNSLRIIDFASFPPILAKR